MINMDSVIIGTAGHVDHGKTALINALTGIDTDRLKEEKERGISIELGFASFPLSNGRIAGIIDVPGHERFIHNMLAGAGGIDLVLLIIDATEGVMPQTREHLFILELLGLEKGLIVLTKVDLVETDWIEIVEEEIREELGGTFLEYSPICRVSSVTGEGLEELKQMLDRLTLTVMSRDSQAPLRLPVDRVFSISGFGTVITGTLVQGKIRVGETVEALPPGRKARVRNLQVFGRNVDEARAGQRVAVNLSGLEKSQLERGSVICHPGYFHLSSLIDASLKILPGAPRAVNHLDPVHLYLGTARVVARVALLDREELPPGHKGLVQLRLESPLVAERKDRFVIRSYSPMTTIGGGLILDPHAIRRYRRFRTRVVDALGDLEEGLRTGKEQSFVLQKIKLQEPADLPALETSTRLGLEKLKANIEELENTGRIKRFGSSLVTPDTAGKWVDKVESFLDEYHRRSPLSPGVSRAHLKSIVSQELPLKDYDLFLDDLSRQKVIDVKDDKVRRAGYTPALSSRDEEYIHKIENIMGGALFQPPFLKDLASDLGLELSYLETLVDYLVNEGKLVKINEEYYILSHFYEKAVQAVRDHFRDSKTMTMAQFRDRLNSSRKYVQPLLEYFDQKRLTRRNGDFRVPWKLE